MKKLFALFALMLGLGFATISVTSINMSKETLSPGESGYISITLSNTGTDVIETASITVYGPSGFSYDDFVPIGDMNPDTTTTISIPVSANADAKSGIYLFEARIYGFSTTANQGNPNYRASVAVNVLKEPILVLSGYPDVFQEANALNLTISNYGGAAKNVRIRALGQFATSGAGEIFIPSIENERTVSLYLDSANASEGQNTLTLEFTYNDELGEEQAENKSITFSLKKERMDISFVQTGSIVTGKDSRALFRVENGGKALRDVRISFAGENITVKGSEEIRLGDLAGGETREVGFDMYTELLPGTRSVNAYLSYSENGEEKIKSIKITFNVSSDSDVQVLLEAKPIPLARGQEHTLSITVANTWDYPIESTLVKIEGGFFNLMSVQNEQYIGLLGKDDFSSVQFKIAVKDDAARESNLTVYVKYKDGSGQWMEKRKTIPVTISERQVAQDSTPALFIGGAAIIAVAAYFLLRRKKQKNI